MRKTLSALTLDDLAQALKASGCHTVTPDTLQRDIASGAPVNPDGTLNLVAYAAWLIKESDHAH